MNQVQIGNLAPIGQMGQAPAGTSFFESLWNWIKGLLESLGISGIWLYVFIVALVALVVYLLYDHFLGGGDGNPKPEPQSPLPQISEPPSTDLPHLLLSD